MCHCKHRGRFPQRMRHCLQSHARAVSCQAPLFGIRALWLSTCRLSDAEAAKLGMRRGRSAYNAEPIQWDSGVSLERRARGASSPRQLLPDSAPCIDCFDPSRRHGAPSVQHLSIWSCSGHCAFSLSYWDGHSSKPTGGSSALTDGTLQHAQS